MTFNDFTMKESYYVTKIYFEIKCQTVFGN